MVAEIREHVLAVARHVVIAMLIVLMTSEERHIVLAEALAILQEFLEVDRIIVVVILIYISIRITHVTISIERIDGLSHAVGTAIHTSIHRGCQSLQDMHIGKSIERKGIAGGLIGIKFGIGDTIRL